MEMCEMDNTFVQGWIADLANGASAQGPLTIIWGPVDPSGFKGCTVQFGILKTQQQWKPMFIYI